MEHVAFLVALMATSFGAGIVGAILGLGGGILLVPLLTMVFGINLHYAMGASLVSVIATSSGAAATYLRSGLSNIRLGLFLAMATVTGALVGAALSGLVPTRA
ncbi:MAG: TSUP family transporter, partial [Candidatus Rokuibacteriota bacterium]